MSNALEFGYVVGQHLFVKKAGGLGDIGKMVGRMMGGAAPAAKPAARAMTPPPLPVPPGMSRAGLERTTGRILDASGRPVPPKAPPPVPAAPNKVTISPAEAAAGRAKVTISPEEAAAAVPPPRGPAGTAAPSWLRNNQAVQRGIDPSTGVRPGAVAPPPPPVPTAPKVTISPAEAAAGRPKVTISPEEAAAAVPGRNSPRDNQVGRAFTLLNHAGLRPILSSDY